MNHKLLARLGSLIASTILSVFSAVSLVGVDKAQAVTLTYNINLDGGPSGFVKVDNSSVTGIDFEGVAISKGRLYGFTSEGQEYRNLAGAYAIFAEGDFFGVQASGSYSSISDQISPPDEPGGPSFFRRLERNGYWGLCELPLSWMKAC